MTSGERLLLVAQAVRQAERLHQAAVVRIEANRNRTQQVNFAVYFSQQRLRDSWALLTRHTREDVYADPAQ